MLNNQLEKNEKNNMITVYQLSRQQCAPCQVLKSKIENLENKSFTYKYIDIDTQLFPGSIQEQILKQSGKQHLKSLPIVGITRLEDDIEDLLGVAHIRYEFLDDFISTVIKQNG